MTQEPRRLRAALRDAWRRLRSHEDLWERGLPDEVEFWREWIATRGLDWPHDFTQRFDPDTPLQEPALLECVEAVEAPLVRILEVGAGPLTWLGRNHPTKRLALTPVDPLADAYNELLDAAGLTPPVRTRALPGERILEAFGEGAFDIAYARNALDHSADPVAIMRQMVRVVVPGGHVVLRHYADEGETMHYEQLHQFNFSAEDGRLIVWNRRSRVDVSSELADAGTVWAVREPGSGHADWIIAMIQRH